MTTRQHNAFAHRLLAYMGGGVGAGGGGALDIKVKVSAGDTVTDYLAQKLSSADGSVTFAILNPAANEQYDVSIAPIPVTRAAALALIAGNSLAAGRMYLITDAATGYGGNCQIFLFSVSNSSFDPNGFGTFTNTNTATPVEATMYYNITSDAILSMVVVGTQVTVEESVGGNFLTNFNFNLTLGYTVFRECTLSGAGMPTSNWIGNYNYFEGCSFDCANNNDVFGFGYVSATGVNFINSINDSIYSLTLTRCKVLSGTITFGFQGGYIEDSNINFATVTIQDGGQVSGCEFWAGSTVTVAGLNSAFSNSRLENCNIKEGATVTTNGNTLIRCKIGAGKTWTTTDVDYNATNGSLEDLDSTFEVFLNPNPAGLMDMTAYRFAGIVRIGTAGVPAAWDLKQISNFPTDHIFCIIPSTDNTVDVYDAGAGGNNIYLSTAAVVTYDGTKDDTLVVRSGLNDYFRLFQIGGWQAPSA